MQFTKLKKGQLVFNAKTQEKGKVVGEDKATYAVEVIVDQNKEEGTRTTKIVNFNKVDSRPFSPKKKRKGGFREQKAVHEFHKAFNYPQSDKPVALSADDVFKRVVFIQEELIELLAASVDTEEELRAYMDELNSKEREAFLKEADKVGKKDTVDRIVAQTDALTDINVFTQGTGDMMGVNLLPLFEIVMQANMSKLDDNGKPIYNEFGKIQKSHNFTPPEPMLEAEIERQIKAAEKRADRG